MPIIATKRPARRSWLMLSLNKRQPPVRMMTVLRCPTILKLKLLVAPISKNVDRLTRIPRDAETKMAATAAAVY